jgi:hypothetical protein
VAIQVHEASGLCDPGVSPLRLSDTGFDDKSAPSSGLKSASGPAHA